MINKDDLVKIVAKSCGISVEVSSFFFEVFINRLSNKLKPGDLLHFHNHGFFHKRNCRIQIEKTSNSPTPKSYLIQLVLFSSESKIRSDLGDIHFLKIPNLKALWVDDKEFQKSLNAGDFAPYSDRNQLIKSFATKAEVIISGLRKDYDNDLVEELIIPLTFDLNFLVKRGQRSSHSNDSLDTKSSDVEKSTITEHSKESNSNDREIKPKKLKPVPGSKEAEEEGLPWNYGTKFLEKDKTGKSEKVNEITQKSDVSERKVLSKQERDSRSHQAARLKDFEPVTSHTIIQKEVNPKMGGETVKFNVAQTKDEEPKKSDSSNKFTEVKSKSESYRQRTDFGKTKRERSGKYSTLKPSREKAFTDRRNYLPIVAVVSFIVIAMVAVYIYFVKDNTSSGNPDATFATIKPPANLNVIKRDYRLAVSYPYPKMENRITLSGFNREIIFAGELKTNVAKEVQPEIKPEVKTEPKTESVVEVSKKPVLEKKPEPPVVENQNNVTNVVKEKKSRIFLYRGFYVVHVGTYKSEDAADREADKYFDMGYNAIIEVVEPRGRGREYKLNVGDFTSEEFARQFQEKYIK